jgi:hypothetical protein
MKTQIYIWNHLGNNYEEWNHLPWSGAVYSSRWCMYITREMQDDFCWWFVISFINEVQWMQWNNCGTTHYRHNYHDMKCGKVWMLLYMDFFCMMMQALNWFAANLKGNWHAQNVIVYLCFIHFYKCVSVCNIFCIDACVISS